MGVVERDEFDALVTEMSKCKSGVHSKIAKIEDGQAILEAGQKKLEAGHKKLEEAIHGQSIERKEANDEMKLMIESLHGTLSTLVTQTADNTKFISSTKADAEVERRVKAELELVNKPRAEIWHKVKMTAVTVVTGVVVTATASGIWLIVEMYLLIKGES